MNCIRRQHSGLLHYGALHLAPGHIDTVEQVESIVLRDLNDSGLTIDDLKSNTLLLDFRCEGQCDKLVKNIITYFRSVPVMDIAVIFNAKVNVDELDYLAVSDPETLVDHQQWFTSLKQHALIQDTDCDFLCLMRRPSHTRAKLASRLLKEVGSLRISFGSMYQSPGWLVDYQHYFSDHSLPLLLDGITVRDHRKLEYQVDSALFRKCAVNIIVESSSQTDTNSWHSIFVTEKTFKAFGMLQLPIWWAVPGVVDCVRNMGFDVFDDIIDHSYDQEHNEDLRFEMLIKQIKQLESKNLAQLRTELMPRLIANWETLDHKCNANFGQFRRILKDLNLDTAI
jgi:hypothetical protein